jgi:metal-responsive CopG/Arc/MetJ family transcriptional regulator
MKRVISVRLSEQRLEQLDRVAQRLNMNRSQAIDAALRILPEIASGKAEMSYLAPWLIERNGNNGEESK